MNTDSSYKIKKYMEIKIETWNVMIMLPTGNIKLRAEKLAKYVMDVTANSFKEYDRLKVLL